MKNMYRLILSALLITVFVTNANAQATATATATATVVSPISISKEDDMSFGNLSVQTATGGTVVLAPNGSRTRTGGVTLPAVTGFVVAASYIVDGSPNYTYAITLPATAVTLTLAAGAQTMTATSFTSAPSGTGVLTGGAQNLYVGATLNVAAGQAAGVYTSGNFDVTVNYN